MLSHTNVVTPTLEIFVIRPGPDGLARITARHVGEGARRSWVVPAAEGEEAVLDEWAELHDRVLGYPPNW